MFWFKRKKVVVDAFVISEAILKFFPIERAVKHYPEWWMRLPSNQTYYNKEYGIDAPLISMKKCAGFVDLYKRSFVLPLWTDAIIETSKDGTYKYMAATELNIKDDHPPSQHNYSFNDNTHIKIMSPWLMKEKTGVEFLMHHPTYNQNIWLNKLACMPGILNFKYQRATHMNYMARSEVNRFEFKAGTPMAYLTPLTEKDVSFKHHQITNDEWLGMLTGLGYSFTGKYFAIKKKTIAMENEKSKCPFSFK